MLYVKTVFWWLTTNKTCLLFFLMQEKGKFDGQSSYFAEVHMAMLLAKQIKPTKLTPLLLCLVPSNI
jgi:hypothetical protein